MQRRIICLSLLFLFSIMLEQARAQPAFNMPGSADVTRVVPGISAVNPLDKLRGKGVDKIPAEPQEMIPPEADELSIDISRVEIDGVTAFSEDEIKKYYDEYVGKTSRLSVIWKIADQITSHYRSNGYFLSRAYVPLQNIENGVVRIKVVEGRIGRVIFAGDGNENFSENQIVKQICEELKGYVPISYSQLESAMLQVNDVQSRWYFKAVLDAWDEGGDGVSQLILVASAEPESIQLNVNNNSSRFVGPYQSTLSYSGNIYGDHATYLSASLASQIKELRAGSITHSVYLMPRWKIESSASGIFSEPGMSLKRNDIDSKTFDVSMKLAYQLIRQRTGNVSINAAVEGRNTYTDIFGDSPLTREKIRVARLGLDADWQDGMGGYYNAATTINRGLDIWHSSQDGELLLSRDGASSDFTYGEMKFSRAQGVQNFVLITSFAGQIASRTLYSSEQFGYGGLQFGRAYDSSEITGDSGVAFSTEIRNTDFAQMGYLSLTPYIYYDIGLLWSHGYESDTGASAGFGFNISSEQGFNAGIGMAFPLTREINQPLYYSKSSPRLLFELSYAF